ncbi:NHLP bacteriocin export ABC transporter permease/ATPase subunit [Hoyosella subflava]|uniref:ABC transporter-like protein n=1 Tax=Hoyosella subflava (strain DSM 45089 / JCM 17490 / NBRC 109087 / DQS3-9A1) TaxID=443218 RepID=F6EL31_HOYSD|nr:NHLP bacteriocin export ABC transporter permease/ATPase subunit [Hoyosella subflava]AEF42694.1 ABC transporter-like protein [Hoyosella subflava DQS3-9A1]
MTRPQDFPGTVNVRPASGNQPFDVAADGGLYVAQGTLNLFLTRKDSARRHYLATLGPHALLRTARDTVPDGWRLLAVGGPETKVALVPSDEIPATANVQTLDDSIKSTVQRIADAIAAEPERIASLSAQQREALQGAIAGLATVMDGSATPFRPSVTQIGQLTSVLDELGGYLGVTFPPVDRVTAGDSDVIQMQLRAARCRSRVVTLPSRWWKRPGAAYLGFAENGSIPIALIPQRAGYVMRDPADGRVREIDGDLAARFSSTAYVVYAPFPEDASAGAISRSVLKTVRGDLGWLLGFGLLAGVVALVTPLAVAAVFGSVLPTQASGLLAAVTALLAGAAVTLALVTYTQNVVSVRLEGKVAAVLEPGLTDRLLRLPSEFFRKYDTGDLAARAVGLEQIRQLVSGGVLTALLGMVFSLISVGVLFVYSPELGLVALLVISAVLVALGMLNVRSVRQQSTALTDMGNLTAMIYQVIRSISKVRVAGAEQRILARWAIRYRAQQRATYLGSTAQAWVTAITAALPPILALSFYASVTAGFAGDISDGRFLAVLTAAGQFTAALTTLAFAIGPLLAVVPLWHRVKVILDEPAERTGSEQPGALTGKVSVRAVSFAYPGIDESVLSGISIEVEPGEFVAITGHSGSGKSTLLRLILGLDNPTAGVVAYDGKDLRSLDASLVRRQFGVVMQNASPLPGAILTSIVGDSGATEDDAWRAAEAADLADDIRRMPMRMQTIVGEGGLTFSGGQVQRMMIARALVRHPRIVLLDEATSALDDKAQAAVSQRLEQLRTTRIVIAHRLSTIRNADRIYVLEQGRIAEFGTFTELMAHDGPFRELARRQMATPKD